MEYKRLGKTGIRSSVIGFGGIMLNGEQPESCQRMVSKAYNAGVNYFDIAPQYGNAQYMMGPALNPYRNRVTLACKSEKRTGTEVEADLHESLTALQTDHFDIYQLHNLTGYDDIMTALSPGGALEAIIKAQKQGKIRYIGFSSHDDRSALYIMSQFDFDSLLYPHNWACDLKLEKGRLPFELAKQKNMALLALKTLAYRKLNDGEEKRFPNTWYYPIADDPHLASLALRFTLSQDIHVAITPGSEAMMDIMLSDPEALKGNALTQEEMDQLTKAADSVATVFDAG